MTPLPPRPLKGSRMDCRLPRESGEPRRAPVKNELHQTPRVSLPSISGQPDPGAGAAETPPAPPRGCQTSA